MNSKEKKPKKKRKRKRQRKTRYYKRKSASTIVAIAEIIRGFPYIRKGTSKNLKWPYFALTLQEFRCHLKYMRSSTRKLSFSQEPLKILPQKEATPYRLSTSEELSSVDGSTPKARKVSIHQQIENIQETRPSMVKTIKQNKSEPIHVNTKSTVSTGYEKSKLLIYKEKQSIGTYQSISKQQEKHLNKTKGTTSTLGTTDAQMRTKRTVLQGTNRINAKASEFQKDVVERQLQYKQDGKEVQGKHRWKQIVELKIIGKSKGQSLEKVYTMSKGWKQIIQSIVLKQSENKKENLSSRHERKIDVPHEEKFKENNKRLMQSIQLEKKTVSQTPTKSILVSKRVNQSRQQSLAREIEKKEKPIQKNKAIARQPVAVQKKATYNSAKRQPIIITSTLGKTISTKREVHKIPENSKVNKHIASQLQESGRTFNSTRVVQQKYSAESAEDQKGDNLQKFPENLIKTVMSQGSLHISDQNMQDHILLDTTKEDEKTSNLQEYAENLKKAVLSEQAMYILEEKVYDHSFLDSSTEHRKLDNLQDDDDDFKKVGTTQNALHISDQKVQDHSFLDSCTDQKMENLQEYSDDFKEARIPQDAFYILDQKKQDSLVLDSSVKDQKVYNLKECAEDFKEPEMPENAPYILNDKVQDQQLLDSSENNQKVDNLQERSKIFNEPEMSQDALYISNEKEQAHSFLDSSTEDQKLKDLQDGDDNFKEIGTSQSALCTVDQNVQDHSFLDSSTEDQKLDDLQDGGDNFKEVETEQSALYILDQNLQDQRLSDSFVKDQTVDNLQKCAKDFKEIGMPQDAQYILDEKVQDHLLDFSAKNKRVDNLQECAKNFNQPEVPQDALYILNEKVQDHSLLDSSAKDQKVDNLQKCAAQDFKKLEMSQDVFYIFDEKQQDHSFLDSSSENKKVGNFKEFSDNINETMMLQDVLHTSDKKLQNDSFLDFDKINVGYLNADIKEIKEAVSNHVYITSKSEKLQEDMELKTDLMKPLQEEANYNLKESLINEIKSEQVALKTFLDKKEIEHHISDLIVETATCLQNGKLLEVKEQNEKGSDNQSSTREEKNKSILKPILSELEGNEERYADLESHNEKVIIVTKEEILPDHEKTEKDSILLQEKLYSVSSGEEVRKNGQYETKPTFILNNMEEKAESNKNEQKHCKEEKISSFGSEKQIRVLPKTEVSVTQENFNELSNNIKFLPSEDIQQLMKYQKEEENRMGEFTTSDVEPNIAFTDKRGMPKEISDLEQNTKVSKDDRLPEPNNQIFRHLDEETTIKLPTMENVQSRIYWQKIAKSIGKGKYGNEKAISIADIKNDKPQQMFKLSEKSIDKAEKQEEIQETLSNNYIKQETDEKAQLFKNRLKQYWATVTELIKKHIPKKESAHARSKRRWQKLAKLISLLSVSISRREQTLKVTPTSI